MTKLKNIVINKEENSVKLINNNIHSYGVKPDSLGYVNFKGLILNSLDFNFIFEQYKRLKGENFKGNLQMLLDFDNICFSVELYYWNHLEKRPIFDKECKSTCDIKQNVSINIKSFNERSCLNSIAIAFHDLLQTLIQQYSKDDIYFEYDRLEITIYFKNKKSK